MKVIIDADQIPYACGFSCEGEPLSHALQMAKKAMQKIIADTEADEYEVFIAGEGNFREDVAVTQGYKAQRTTPRPEHWEGVRNYLKEQWGATEVDDMEVDDHVSILLWGDFIKGGSTLILSSGDKDLNNTPGMHYNPRTRKKYWVTRRQATRHFWYQMLAGDKVDNIPGLPNGTESLVELYPTLTRHVLKGFGDKSAKRVLEHSVSEESAVVAGITCYVHWAKDAGLEFSEMLEYITEQGQLLWMVRELDDLGSPVMWEPDSVQAMHLWKEYGREFET